MSVFDNIQKLFKPKDVQLEDSMDLASVGAPVDVLASAAREEASMRGVATGSVDGRDDLFGSSTGRPCSPPRIAPSRRCSHCWRR